MEYNRDFLKTIYFPTNIPATIMETKDLKKKSKNINLRLLFNIWPINLSIENFIGRPLLKMQYVWTCINAWVSTLHI